VSEPWPNAKIENEKQPQGQAGESDVSGLGSGCEIILRLHSVGVVIERKKYQPLPPISELSVEMTDDLTASFKTATEFFCNVVLSTCVRKPRSLVEL